MNARRLKAEIIAEYGTQTAFAHAIGWHANKVSKIVKEKYKPDTDEVAKISDALHLDERRYCEIFLPKASPFGDTKPRQNIHESRT